MKSFLSARSLVAVLTVLSACTHPARDARTPASDPALPANEEQARFFEEAAKLDLADPQYELTASSGGTSAYAKITVKGSAKPWGAFLPANSATNPFGEAFSFHLARALGFADLVGYGAIKTIDGAAFARFRDFLKAQKFSSSSKEANRKEILQKMANASSLTGVLKLWNVKPLDYDAIASGNGLRTSHPIAKFVQATGPQPTDKVITLEGLPGSASEKELARQLSNLLVLDTLTGQWDRWSGGNFQAALRPDGKTLFFIALDNGGTWSGDNWLKKYLGWVTRFDRRTASQVAALNGFLNEGSGSFLAFTAEADLQQAMDMQLAPDLWKSFKKKLAAVAAHIENVGGDKFFTE